MLITPPPPIVARLTPAQIRVPRTALTLPDGIQYVVVHPGFGKTRATPQNDVTITAYGWWFSGKAIDSPDLHGRPYTYHLRHLIIGWQTAVSTMSTGETAKFWMPPRVTHSAEHGNEAGGMIFLIHLVSIRRHSGAEERPGIY